MPETKAEQLERRGPRAPIHQAVEGDNALGDDRDNSRNTEWKRIPLGRVGRWLRAHQRPGGHSYFK